MKFSKYFGLNHTQPELDFVDIDTSIDMPLFIDPYYFTRKNDLWSITCHNEIISFFQAVIDNIRSGNADKAQRLLNNLSEPNDTYLGFSSGKPQGKGVSGKQSIDLFKKLSESEAVKTGVLSELSDCELMIDGIGHDKISDITTNIIRSNLITYTQAQCSLHDIELKGEVASGRIWDPAAQEWTQDYVKLPIIQGKRVVLVPKASVRRKMALDHREYYQHYVLNFLQEEYLAAGSSLIQVLKSGKKRVYKKDLSAKHPISKELLFSFTKDHPEILAEYKKLKGYEDPIENIELEYVDDAIFASAIRNRLQQIKQGTDQATEFHHLMVGVIEYLFYPDLIYPQKEVPIHSGRKRIDITYTNNATSGFFFRAHTSQQMKSAMVMVECKNYSSDPKNPELDQLSGRFNDQRGWFGFLVARHFEDRDLFLARCRDTANDRRGIIIPLVDTDIEAMLGLIERRQRDQIDHYIESIFREVIR